MLRVKKIIKVVRGQDLNPEGETSKANTLTAEPLLLYGLFIIAKPSVCRKHENF